MEDKKEKLPSTNINWYKPTYGKPHKNPYK